MWSSVPKHPKRSRFSLCEVLEEMDRSESDGENDQLPGLESAEAAFEDVLDPLQDFEDTEEYPPPSTNPKESRAISKSEAQEGPRIESVHTQEESFDQEWCASLKQVAKLTFVKDEEVPRLECVPIKEEFIEHECVSIAEEVPTENNVCTLEENNKQGSSLCDDCPSECELGFRGETPFPGTDCHSSHLKIDQRVDKGEKPYHCTECGKRFTKLQNLKRHQHVHTGEKPYHCIECGTRFSRLSNLKRHVRSHTGEKPYHCTQCGKSFTRLGSLQSHQRTHTGEKPYHCSECGKSFTRLGSLQSHPCILTGEKSYD